LFQTLPYLLGREFVQFGFVFFEKIKKIRH
jgi:hypothetical protein